MRKFSLKHWHAEKISRTVFYVLTSVSAVVTLLFFLVGFDGIYLDNPDYNEPLFTDVLLCMMIFMPSASIVVAIYSMIKGVKNGSDAEKIVNGIPGKKISWSVFAGTLILLVATFAFGSSEPILINGWQFENGFLLRMSDQFIMTSLVLLTTTAASALYGLTRYSRKKK